MIYKGYKKDQRTIVFSWPSHQLQKTLPPEDFGAERYLYKTNGGLENSWVDNLFNKIC